MHLAAPEKLKENGPMLERRYRTHPDAHPEGPL